MDDEQLTALLVQERWHVPPPPPADAIWTGVERALVTGRAPRRPDRPWTLMIGSIAAALILGVLVGRASVGRPARAMVMDSASATADLEPYRRTVEQLLGQSAVLLASLPQGAGAASGEGAIAEQGSQLLATVRLLLDSPIGSDPRLSALLADLELVLVQVARLESVHPDDELLLIHDALDARDIVPRIRSVVVDYSLQLN